jgi:hypothetical protein
VPDTKPHQDDPDQSQRFIDMAREVEAKENEAVFDRTFVRVASLPREPPKKPKACEET